MSKTNKKTRDAANSNPVTPISKSDGVLDLAKGKFNEVIVIGVTPNGGLDVASTSNRYDFLHHSLNRAEFELIIHERNAIAEAQQVAAEAQEAPAT